MVKDSAAQTTPPDSPAHRRHDAYRSRPEVTVGQGSRSRPDVTAESKVNDRATTEFRTIVNVFDDGLRQNSSDIVSAHGDRPGVVIDTDSLQSTAVATENGPRVYTDKLRRANGLHPTAQQISSSKGLCPYLCKWHTYQKSVPRTRTRTTGTIPYHTIPPGLPWSGFATSNAVPST